jgi:asparagine synthase (glutamine-hydrolysing)
MKFDDRSPKRVAPLLSPSIGREKGPGDERGSWLLRWNPDTQPSPEVLLPQEPRSDFAAHIHTGPAGFVLFEGYLFDKTDYLSDPDASPAPCVANAYEDYDDGLFDHLRGGYALAVWDQERRRLLAGRDALGLHPMYYCWDGRLLILSPDMDQILSQPEVNGAFNRTVLAEYMLNFWPAHQRSETFYAEVRRLPLAHQLSVTHNNLEITRYWDPLPPGYAWATQEELETLVPLLERAVQRRLSVGADSLALSGGYDSVSIAALAAEQLRGVRPLHAVSLRFSLDGVDEGSTQVAVARALEMPQVMCRVDEFLESASFVDASLALSRGSPSPVLSQWQVMYSGLLQSAAELGLSKLLMGTGGDEMFTVDLAYGTDLMASLNFRGLWRYYRAMQRTSPFSPARVARVVLWNHAAIPVLARWLRPSLKRIAPHLIEKLRQRREALFAWLYPEDPELRRVIQRHRFSEEQERRSSGESDYVSAIRGLLQSPLLMAELEQGFSWSRRAGFTLLYPFFDRDLVELALRMHPEYLLSEGYAKSPLRRLVAKRLGQISMPTKKVDFTRQVTQILRAQGKTVWQNLERPWRLEQMDIIAPERFSPVMQEYFAGRNNYSLQTWQFLSAESWLRARGN